MEASGVAPSPSRLLAEIPPLPNAQGNTVPSMLIRPWEGFPGRARTVNMVKGLPIFRSAPLRSLFLEYDLFEYDRITKQITLPSAARKDSHKGLPVNYILDFEAMD